LAKIYCVECGVDITDVEHFSCSLCGEKVCMDCQKKHVAKCMTDKWHGEYLPGEKKSDDL